MLKENTRLLADFFEKYIALDKFYKLESQLNIFLNVNLIVQWA